MESVGVERERYLFACKHCYQLEPRVIAEISHNSKYIRLGYASRIAIVVWVLWHIRILSPSNFHVHDYSYTRVPQPMFPLIFHQSEQIRWFPEPSLGLPWSAIINDFAPVLVCVDFKGVRNRVGRQDFLCYSLNMSSIITHCAKFQGCRSMIMVVICMYVRTMYVLCILNRWVMIWNKVHGIKDLT